MRVAIASVWRADKKSHTPVFDAGDATSSESRHTFHIKETR